MVMSRTYRQMFLVYQSSCLVRTIYMLHLINEQRHHTALIICVIGLGVFSSWVSCRLLKYIYVENDFFF